MQHQPNDFSNVVYRIEIVEKDIISLRQQLSLYEPARENDLKLQTIKETTSRIESELTKVKEKIETINSRMVVQEQEAVTRDAKQKQETDKIQIRVLLWVVTTVISILTLTLVGYLTHFFK